MKVAILSNKNCRSGGVGNQPSLVVTNPSQDLGNPNGTARNNEYNILFVALFFRYPRVLPLSSYQQDLLLLTRCLFQTDDAWAPHHTQKSYITSNEEHSEPPVCPHVDVEWDDSKTQLREATEDDMKVLLQEERDFSSAGPTASVAEKVRKVAVFENKKSGWRPRLLQQPTW